MSDSNLKKTRSKKLGRKAKAEDRATIDLNLIETIVIVMMENRSFDHMLGHLSYRQYANRTKVDGLQDPLNQQAYENIYEGEPYYPFEMKDGTLPSDLPHEREYVKTQLAYSPVTGSYSMSGFVDAYYQVTTANRTEKPEPMGFFPPNEAPITSFLANNFAVCDRWFTPLPTSTHPNRCIALGSSTPIDSTGQYDHSLKVDSLVLDWLDKKDVRWRVYHHGVLSCFYLFRLGFVLDPRFCSFDHLKDDINAPVGEFPQVVFIEPSYEGANQNDNHPPVPVSYGELFLRDIYQILVSNQERWKKTVMILTYDEHGGFFDHVPPLSIPYAPLHGEFPPFKTTGPRVPAIIVSPFVSSRYVYQGNMDHTSILQFLAERFAPHDGGYSDSVNIRRDQGINSVRNVLNLSVPRADIPSLPALKLHKKAMVSKVRVQKNPLQSSLENIVNRAIKLYPDEIKKNRPELLSWHKASSIHTAGKKKRRKSVPKPTHAHAKKIR